MSKKYLIENARDFGGMSLEVFKEDAKEVEVLDNSQIDTLDKSYAYSEYITFSDYLKANNLQIIKIKE